MTTTTMTMKKTTRTICKWSGDTEDEYSWRDDDHRDEDTVTMTADERRYIEWYHAQARVQWRDADVELPAARAAAGPAAAAAANKTIEHKHVPFMNLTKEERDKKSKLFNFGLCSDCDAGLHDESEFVCKPRPNAAPLLTCNACSDYFLNLEFMHVGCGEERGGCN